MMKVMMIMIMMTMTNNGAHFYIAPAPELKSRTDLRGRAAL